MGADPQILWRRLDLPGHDACRIWRDGDVQGLDGVAVWRDPSGPAHLAYHIACDGAWVTRSVRVQGRVGSRELTLSIHRADTGEWRVNGESLPDLHGLQDMDLGFTPATNTLPIRRLGLALGETRAVRAAYVPLPSEIKGDFLPRPAEQRYTRLADRLWRYEGLFRDFTADLAVDDLGLVLDYPGLFRRLSTADSAPLGDGAEG